MTAAGPAKSGGRPPWRENRFAQHMRLPEIGIRDGAAHLELTVDDVHLRPGGILHGGVVATLLDTVLGYAAYHAAADGTEVVTMQLNINMTAAAQLGDRVIARATIAHKGRRTAVTQGELRRADGKLLATGSATMFYITEGLR